MLFAIPSNAQNGGIVVTPWRMYEGNLIKLDKKSVARGDTNAYKFMQIPDPTDNGWKPAEYGDDGEVKFSRQSKIPSCGDYIQPTYFESTVTIPPGTQVNTFAVSYIRADDGARIYVNGKYDPKADLRFGQSKIGDINFSRFVTSGKNRVVIAQFDDCPVLNNVHGIDIKVNGEEVTPKVLPPKFRLHAYSVHGKRVEKGSDYWMGFKPSEKGPRIPGRILSAKTGTVMEIEKEELGDGIVALKVANGPDAGSFLTIQDDNSVKVMQYPSSNARTQFKVRPPLEKEASDLSYLSFESVWHPNYFLRHANYQLFVSPATAADMKNMVYRQDASWLFEPTK